MTDNLNLEETNPLDPSNFRKMIYDSADQFEVGFELAKETSIPGNFQQVMISGMGGSSLPSNLLRTYLYNLYKVHEHETVKIFQNRFYTLPPESYHNCLNIISSYSGNTEETIASFEEALENKLPCVGISSGGEIERICKENNVPHVKLPIPMPNFQPRIGTGYIFSTIYQILINIGKAPDTTKEILSSARKLKGEMQNLEVRGQELANKVEGKTPVIFTSTHFKGLAMIWKIKFNENSKTPAFWNYFPELNHNEMVGFTNLQGKFVCIMLRDPEDHPLNLKRFETTAALLKRQGIETEIIDLSSDDIFFNMFESLALGDFTSYALALKYNQDPTPVNMVEELKGLLAKSE